MTAGPASGTASVSNEDSGAYRGPDPEHGQLEQADRTAELAALLVGVRLVTNASTGFLRTHFAAQSMVCS